MICCRTSTTNQALPTTSPKKLVTIAQVVIIQNADALMLT